MNLDERGVHVDGTWIERVKCTFLRTETKGGTKIGECY